MSDPLLATEATQITTEEPQTDQGAADSESTAATEQLYDKSQEESETTTEEPKDETAKDEKSEAEETEGAPETYEFKAPESLEGVEIDSSIHDAYAEAARELDLTQDKAQGLFDKTMAALHKRAMDEQARMTKEWTDAAKADPEIGGEKLDENIGIAKKAVTEFGSEGLQELLSIPNGLGDHPEMIRFLFKVGQAISQDRFVGSDQGTTVDPSDESAQAAKLYPSSVK